MHPGIQGETRRNDYGQDAPLGGKRFAVPELVRGFHGIPCRTHRIKALGNSVCPQIPELIGRAILKAESPKVVKYFGEEYFADESKSRNEAVYGV